MRLGEALSARGLVCAVLCSAGADAAFFKASQDKSSQVFLFPSHSLLFSSNYLPTCDLVIVRYAPGGPQFRGHAGYFPKVCVSSWRGLLLDVSRMCTCSVCVCASQLSPSLRVSVSLRRLSPPLLGASLESTFDRPRNRLTLLCISEIRITVRTFDFSSTLDAARPRHAYRVQAAAPEPVAQSAKPQTRFRLGSG